MQKRECILTIGVALSIIRGGLAISTAFMLDAGATVKHDDQQEGSAHAPGWLKVVFGPGYDEICFHTHAASHDERNAEPSFAVKEAGEVSPLHAKGIREKLGKPPDEPILGQAMKLGVKVGMFVREVNDKLCDGPRQCVDAFQDARATQAGISKTQRTTVVFGPKQPSNEGIKGWLGFGICDKFKGLQCCPGSQWQQPQECGDGCYCCLQPCEGMVASQISDDTDYWQQLQVVAKAEAAKAPTAQKMATIPAGFRATKQPTRMVASQIGDDTDTGSSTQAVAKAEPAKAPTSQKMATNPAVVGATKQPTSGGTPAMMAAKMTPGLRQPDSSAFGVASGGLVFIVFVLFPCV